MSDPGALGGRSSRGRCGECGMADEGPAGDYADGQWRFIVPGGPAFAMNAALACRIAHKRGQVCGDLFRRLADAIEAAMPE